VLPAASAATSPRGPAGAEHTAATDPTFCRVRWRLHEDGRKLFQAPIEAADHREFVLKWSAFLATAERGTYFATYRGSFVGPEPALANSDALAA
jgi:hypothetical protein